jgi:hypothetical protein
MHFDVSPTGCDQDAELARLLAAGARPRISDKAVIRDGTYSPLAVELQLRRLLPDPAAQTL